MNESILMLLKLMAGLLILVVATLFWPETKVRIQLDETRARLPVSGKQLQEVFSGIQSRVVRQETRFMIMNMRSGEKV